MLTFEHGNGLSMKSINEFTEMIESNNPKINAAVMALDELINLSNKIDDLDNTLKLKNNVYENNNCDLCLIWNVKEPFLFEKLEQIINSFEKTTIKIINNDIIITSNTFKQNQTISKYKNPNYFTLYWFIRNSLVREIYKYSLEQYKITSDAYISLDKTIFNPKDISNKIKNMKYFYTNILKA